MEKGKKMMYFITFLAGMGFAALVDLTIQAVRRHRGVPLDIEKETFTIDPTTTKVGTNQMARVRQEMGI